jgi:hypothetical protein
VPAVVAGVATSSTAPATPVAGTIPVCQVATPVPGTSTTGTGATGAGTGSGQVPASGPDSSRPSKHLRPGHGAPGSAAGSTASGETGAGPAVTGSPAAGAQTGTGTDPATGLAGSTVPAGSCTPSADGARPCTPVTGEPCVTVTAGPPESSDAVGNVGTARLRPGTVAAVDTPGRVIRSAKIGSVAGIASARAAVVRSSPGGGAVTADAAHDRAPAPVPAPDPLPLPLPLPPPPPVPASSGSVTSGGARASDGQQNDGSTVDLPVVTLVADTEIDLTGTAVRRASACVGQLVDAARDPGSRPD